MAQIVKNFQDNVYFSEGPFVVVNINGWTIGCEKKGCGHPVVPDVSIRDLMERWGRTLTTNNKDDAKNSCNCLNEMAKTGDITLAKNWWVLRKEIDDFREVRVEKVTNISKKYNFPEYGQEFWRHQPSGVVSLIINLNEKLKGKDKNATT